MSATTILNTAPLGALIRYTDHTPKPPTRFTLHEGDFASDGVILVTIRSTV